MSTTDFDKDALANLTPEERAAIEDENYSPEELEAMKAVAGADDEDDSEGEGEGEGGDGKAGDAAASDEGKPDVKADNPAAKTDDSAAAAVADTEGADPEKKAAPATDESKGPEFQPRYQVALPADYEASVAALKEDKRALSEKFKAGDVEIDDYTTQMEALDDRRDALNDLRVRAAIAQDMNTQTSAQQWKFTIDRFTKNIARDEKIDYSADLEKQADLDTFVKALAANPKNADKDMEWFLNEAHRRVKAFHGIVTTDPTPEQKPAAKPTRKSPVDALPATLAQVPGSDGPGDVSGEFSELDSLEGLDYEQAIAKMTPVQRERFVQGK